MARIVGGSSSRTSTFPLVGVTPRGYTRVVNPLKVLTDAPALDDALAAHTASADLVEPHGDALRCLACAHRCVVSGTRAGACGVRFARDGELRVPFGYVARAYVRPVETNTVYHVLPGALALTFGMYGCDLRCPYCHNHKVSQALRDGAPGETPRPTTPSALVHRALEAGCRVLCAAYNEPMIAAEWVRAVFTEARAAGLVTAIVTDGNSTPEAIAYVRPVTDVFRVDLKGFTNEQYRTLGGRLGPVLDAIREARRHGLWVEVVTLVVPGLNDDMGGLRRLASTLADIDSDIPWHLNAFQPRYRMADGAPPDAGLLVSAAGAAYARGMRFVYAGNIDDTTRELSHTRCPRCHAVLVRRGDYTTTWAVPDPSRCTACDAALPGIWSLPPPRAELERSTPGAT